MKKLFKTPKAMIITAIASAALLVLFNVYDIAFDKTDKAAYTQEDIENVQVDMVNINTADMYALCTLPGVGESTAQKIIDYREANGKFKSIEEIQNVDGIGQRTYIEMQSMITI